MNLVYKFTSRVSNKYYIGSKTECEFIEGKILDRDGRFYNSSCSSEEFWEELAAGNLDLEVLEGDIKRESLLDREAYWQIQYDYKSDMCWNIVLATQLHAAMSKEVQQRICNVYGQTINEFCVDNSTVSRLDTRAKKDGFSDYGDKTLRILSEREELGTYAAVDNQYGWLHHSARVGRDKCITDYDVKFKKLDVSALMRNGASFIKACELIGVKHYVARYAFGDDFDSILDRVNYISEVNGFETRELFNNKVMYMFLSGMPRQQITQEFKNVSMSTITRVIDAEIRTCLNKEDYT